MLIIEFANINDCKNDNAYRLALKQSSQITSKCLRVYYKLTGHNKDTVRLFREVDAWDLEGDNWQGMNGFCNIIEAQRRGSAPPMIKLDKEYKSIAQLATQFPKATDQFAFKGAV